MAKKPTKKAAEKKPAAKRSSASRSAAPAETPTRAKTSPLPTKEHKRICVTDANRSANAVVDIHESAFDGPKVLYNGQWLSHKDEVVVNGETLWRYAP